MGFKYRFDKIILECNDCTIKLSESGEVVLFDNLEQIFSYLAVSNWTYIGSNLIYCPNCSNTFFKSKVKNLKGD